MLRSLPILFAFALVGPASLAQTADLAVDKSVDQSEVDVSDEATFYIAVTNSGPDAAEHVIVADMLPAGLAFADAHPSQGHYDPASGAWTVGTLDAGDRALLELTTVLIADTAVQNCAGVDASGAEDKATANNSSCAIVRPKFKSIRPKREKLDPIASAFPPLR